MSNKSRGSQRELAVKRELESQGWFVVKAGGSLGLADLVALKRGEIGRLVEVKSDDPQYGPFNNLGPDRRKELLAAAYKAGCKAVLAYWPSRGKLAWIKPEDWPS